MPEHVLPPVGVVRDYLLEHWTPEPPETECFMVEFLERMNDVRSLLPHYCYRPWGSWGDLPGPTPFPRLTRLQMTLLTRLGASFTFYQNYARRVGDCVLRNWS